VLSERDSDGAGDDKSCTRDYFVRRADRWAVGCEVGYRRNSAQWSAARRYLRPIRHIARLGTTFAYTRAV